MNSRTFVLFCFFFFFFIFCSQRMSRRGRKSTAADIEEEDDDATKKKRVAKAPAKKAAKKASSRSKNVTKAPKKRERAEEDEGDDEEEVDEAKQKELDDAFLKSCSRRSLKDVKRTLTAGAWINAQDVDGDSGLIVACRRGKFGREGTLEIVKFLLSKRCSPALVDKTGRNAVSVAAQHAPPEVLKLFLSKEPHLSQVKTIKGWTPLAFLCRYRFDDDTVRIAELLLDTGADIEQGSRDCTPLLLACRYGRADLVSLLLQREASIKAVTDDGHNCLHLACKNGAFGTDIIPLLIKVGVDAVAKGIDGKDALAFALGTNFDVAETLLQHLPQGINPANSVTNLQDPIGKMAVLVQLGWRVKMFRAVGFGANNLWARLRNGKKQLFDGSVRDVFNVLSESNDPKLWILASSEPCFQQHPKTGNTVLHLLSRTDKLNFDQKMEVLSALKKDYRNPLIPNFQNERAIDLTNDSALKVELARYMEWQPNRWAMKWYGPLFRERAFALLLVLKRYPRAYMKDIRHLLVKYLAKVEHIYVPSKV